MTRPRASLDGGYTRKTISIPNELLDRIEQLRQDNPEETFSSFMCAAARKVVELKERRREKTS